MKRKGLTKTTGARNEVGSVQITLAQLDDCAKRWQGHSVVTVLYLARSYWRGKIHCDRAWSYSHRWTRQFPTLASVRDFLEDVVAAHGYGRLIPIARRTKWSTAFLIALLPEEHAVLVKLLELDKLFPLKTPKRAYRTQAQWQLALDMAAAYEHATGEASPATETAQLLEAHRALPALRRGAEKAVVAAVAECMNGQGMHVHRAPPPQQ